MEQLTKKELERILSLYVDGELDSAEVKKMQDYLSTHPQIEREVKFLQSAKQSLSHKKKILPNEWFWLRLVNKIEIRRNLRFPFLMIHRSSISLALVATVIIIIIGGVYIKDAPLFHKFFKEKKEFVQNSLLSGNIFPLFTNLTNDDVLHFALLGALPIDSSKKTELQVKNDENKRTQFEIVKKFGSQIPKAISVSDFCNNLGVTADQQVIVDSILGTYKQKLQTAVLVGENKEIAIHEELGQMNRAMLSTIAASLEPVQKMRFRKYLNDLNAPYSVIAVNDPAIAPKVIFSRIPEYPRTNRYVIVSKDTVGIAEMKMNVDSIRDIAYKSSVRLRHIATEKMMRDLAEIQQGFEQGITVSGNNRNEVRLHSTNNAFQINFESSFPTNDFEANDNVISRVRVPVVPLPTANEFEMMGDSAFIMEMHADKSVMKILKRLPSGEFRLEYIDSIKQSPRMKLLFKSNTKEYLFDQQLQKHKKSEERLIDLDSLLREDNKRRDVQQVPKHQSPKLYEM